jgi:hypothetical protein
LSEAPIIAAASLQSCPIETLTAEIMRLRFSTKRSVLTEQEQAMQNAIYIEVLAEYPADIVISVLHDWPKSGNPFWPELGDLCARCNPLLDKRRHLQDGLERAAHPPKPVVEVDEREPWTPERRAEHEAKMAVYWREFDSGIARVARATVPPYLQPLRPLRGLDEFRRRMANGKDDEAA